MSNGLGRRGFLRRGALVVGAFVAGVLGVEPAHASRHRCCELCRRPWQCEFGYDEWEDECASILAWTCVWPEGGNGGEGYQVTYACLECYREDTSGNCFTAGCGDVRCSAERLISGYYPDPC